jgi:hypothetical protein
VLRAGAGSLAGGLSELCDWLVQEAKADVVPLVILGNYELWPPNRLFTCTGQVGVCVSELGSPRKR